MSSISRRGLMRAGLAGAAGVGGIAVAGHIAGRYGLIPPDAGGLYGCGHTLTFAAQRLLAGSSPAREFVRSQISQTPHPNGPPPQGDEYARLRAGGFEDWRLQVDGMVKRPGSLSLANLRGYPSRSQITQLICEEGWSFIAEWKGAPLSHVLTVAEVRPEARYAVFESMDGWLDAIDMNDAWHAQTLLSYGMNGGELPVGHGGPLRLRVPRQLGYKSLKFIKRVTLTDTLRGVALGSDYSWYAGI